MMYSSCDLTFTSSKAHVPADRSKPEVKPPTKPKLALPIKLSGLNHLEVGSARR